MSSNHISKINNKLIGDGADLVHIEDLVHNLKSRSIERAEIDEAIDHLILQNLIYEIDEDCFVPSIND